LLDDAIRGAGGVSGRTELMGLAEERVQRVGGCFKGRDSARVGWFWRLEARCRCDETVAIVAEMSAIRQK
jgi:hypothetical protein